MADYNQYHGGTMFSRASNGRVRLVGTVESISFDHGAICFSFTTPVRGEEWGPPTYFTPNCWCWFEPEDGILGVQRRGHTDGSELSYYVELPKKEG